jgi:dsDNA-binding SOS-regulon protein
MKGRGLMTEITTKYDILLESDKYEAMLDIIEEAKVLLNLLPQNLTKELVEALNNYRNIKEKN